MLEGIKYLHANNVCHRDIKPDNIMITKLHSAADSAAFKVKIGDFNIAKNFKNRLMMTKTGMDEWNAPELLTG